MMDAGTVSSTSLERKRDPMVIAVVSGKGGSGKTMISAAIALSLARADGPALAIDADFATAGLTHYLSLSACNNVPLRGFSDIARQAFEPDLPSGPPLQLSLGTAKWGSCTFDFLGAGDLRWMYSGGMSHSDLGPGITSTMRRLKDLDYRWIIVDCRGGIDAESLAVCECADHIIVVTEPDVPALQSTQLLMLVLQRRISPSCIAGFILNKVIEDPTVVERHSMGLFSCRHLVSIPYDFEAVRSFLVGNLPAQWSTLNIHVQAALARGIPEAHLDPPPNARIWRGRDFASAGMRHPDSDQGGIILALGFSVLAVFMWFRYSLLSNIDSRLLAVALCGLSVLSCTEFVRRALGYAGRRYMQFVAQLLGFRRGDG